MYHPALSRIRRLHVAMDNRETNILAASREITALAKALEIENPDAFSAYQAIVQERQERLRRNWEALSPDSENETTQQVGRSAQSTVTPLRNFYSDAAVRRRETATARRWCIESGIWTIRDMTDTQSRVLVELLRECLKAKRRATYLTHDQLAERAGCSRSTVKTTIRLLIERSLFFVRRERLSARKNAPNLYLPCRQVVQALGPYVSPTMSIGGQDTAPLGLRDNKSLNPTEIPTSSENQKNVKKVGDRVETHRKPRPKPDISAEDRDIIVQAIPLLDGSPISPKASDDELHARIDTIRAILLPDISSTHYDQALRNRAAGAAVALLATAMKAMTRTINPIRSPVAYFRGTVSPRRPMFNPHESLRITVAEHLSCNDRKVIHGILSKRVHARENNHLEPHGDHISTHGLKLEFVQN